MWGYLRPSEIPILDKYLNNEVRDKVIFRLMYRMGLREGEVVGGVYDYDVLDPENEGEKLHAHSVLPGVWTDDINFDTKTLTVKGKGDLTRSVPIPPDVMDDILSYLKYRRWDGRTNVQLIVRYKDDKPMTTANVRKLWIKIKKEAGLRKNIRVHDLRHTFACNYLINGGDVRDLMSLLGHSDLKITYLYIEKIAEETNEDARKVMERSAYMIKHPINH